MVQSGETRNTTEQALKPGTRVLGYEIKRVLGVGGFGIVYEGFNRVLDHRAAIKEFFPAALAIRHGTAVVLKSEADREMYERILHKFEQSTTVLRKLEHPNIARVHGYEQASNTGYQIMDFIEGETLEAVFAAQGEALDPARLRALFQPVCQALDYVHSKGVLHRDLKPGNIMVRKADGAPILIDFGALKQILTDELSARTSLVIASPAYAPPEQLGFLEAEHKPCLDVYSLAATMYVALTGREPAAARTRSARQISSEADPYVPIASALTKPIDSALATAIDRAMRFQPAARPQSMREFEDLLGWSDGADTKTTKATIMALPRAAAPVPASPSTDRGAPVRRSRLAAAALAVAVLGGGAAAVWTLLSGSPKPQMPQAAVTQPATRPSEPAPKPVAPVTPAPPQQVATKPAPTPAHPQPAETKPAPPAERPATKPVETAPPMTAPPQQVAIRPPQAPPAPPAPATPPAIETAPSPPPLPAPAVPAETPPAPPAALPLDRPLTAAEARQLKPKDEFQECLGCPRMVVVAAGRFRMGSPPEEPDRGADEGPPHDVRIGQPFAVGKLAVTFDQWAACVADGGCKSNPAPSDQGWGRGTRPVINVSWTDVQEYVAWLSRKSGRSYRLMSESEREYVLRAGTTTPYTVETSAARPKQTLPADALPPNAFGLHQVTGNVWEWVADCWNDSYLGAPGDGTAWLAGDCSRRVVRGGSWESKPVELRSAYRNAALIGDRDDRIGFRIARTLD